MTILVPVIKTIYIPREDPKQLPEVDPDRIVVPFKKPVPAEEPAKVAVR